MYGDVNQDYANLLKQASSYAKSQTQAATVQESQSNMRTWILVGSAGLATMLLLALVIRR